MLTNSNGGHGGGTWCAGTVVADTGSASVDERRPQCERAFWRYDGPEGYGATATATMTPAVYPFGDMSLSNSSGQEQKSEGSGEQIPDTEVMTDPEMPALAEDILPRGVGDLRQDDDTSRRQHRHNKDHAT